MWVEVAHQSAHHAGFVSGLLSQAPPQGTPPDAPATAPQNLGAKFTTILGMVKWVALAAVIVTFFAGVVVFTAGRVADHRHGASTGSKLLIAAGAGAVLYAIGYGLVTSLAAT